VLSVAWAVIEIVKNLGGPEVKIDKLPPRKGERRTSTDLDVARGDGWDRLGGWHPVFDYERLAEAVESYRP
jgi:hypothetical protein